MTKKVKQGQHNEGAMRFISDNCTIHGRRFYLFQAEYFVLNGVISSPLLIVLRQGGAINGNIIVL